MRRGGQPKLEEYHARELLKADAENIWGWSSPAGIERVKARAKWLIDVCSLREGVRVLECGCGTGIFTRHLAETKASITAVDISADLLNEARKKCPAENVTFIQANLEDPKELQDEYFDVLCGVSILHHLMLPDALNMLRNKLNMGARFAFSEPNILNPINRYKIFVRDPEKRRKLGVSPTEMAFHPKELVQLFQEAGYNVLKIENRDFLHPSTPTRLIKFVQLIQLIAEKVPVLKAWSGSLWISGIKPW